MPREAVLGLIDRIAIGRTHGLSARRRESGRLVARSGWTNATSCCFDGTFWTEDELCRVRGGGKAELRQMGHLPLSGPCGSLAALRDIQCPRKIFFHINNTNPILDESSEAYRRGPGCRMGSGSRRNGDRTYDGYGRRAA